MELVTGSVRRNAGVGDQPLVCRQGQTFIWAEKSKWNLNSSLHGPSRLHEKTGKELKNRKDKNNPSKKDTNLLDRMKRLIWNGFGNSGSHNQTSTLFITKEHRYSALTCPWAVQVGREGQSEVWERFTSFKFKHSYEWRTGGRSCS